MELDWLNLTLGIIILIALFEALYIFLRFKKKMAEEGRLGSSSIGDGPEEVVMQFRIVDSMKLGLGFSFGVFLFIVFLFITLFILQNFGIKISEFQLPFFVGF